MWRTKIVMRLLCDEKGHKNTTNGFEKYTFKLKVQISWLKS